MGIFSSIAGVALLVSMNSYRGTTFNNDRNLLVATLAHARAQAINNICLGSGCADGKKHGVHIQSDAYIAFQGTTYNPADATNARFDSSTLISKSGLTDIIFSQLSATTTTIGDIVLSLNERISTTTIGSNGTIVWTH